MRPTSVMGASKRLGEMVLRSLAGHSTTKFMPVLIPAYTGWACKAVKHTAAEAAPQAPVQPDEKLQGEAA